LKGVDMALLNMCWLRLSDEGQLASSVCCLSTWQ